MKKLILPLIISFLMCYTNSNAQTATGKVLVGVSSSFATNGGTSSLMSFGFSTSKYKDDNGDIGGSDNMINLNLQPKIGYFVNDNLVLGLDLSLLYSKSSSDLVIAEVESTSTVFSIGPFVRYYIPMGNIAPYAEAFSGFGSFTSKYDPTVGSTKEEKANIVSLGGGLGIAVSLGE
ncbi:MAG: outer membrane beta-barrel protein [Bacteroidales bacterium]|nr:outer membrane beta-barrel protein [Bacteroidales bacterium]